MIQVGLLLLSLPLLLSLYVGWRYFWATPRCTKPPRTHIDPLLQLSAVAISAKLREGSTTSVQLVSLCIDLIRRVNPHLNAMVFERFQEAMLEAARADERLARARKARSFDGVGWLTGVPCTVKECIAVAGCPQSSGLTSRAAFRADADSIQVRRLKEAGGIVLGVTNTSELCMWMESSNYVYGTTKNAYDTRRIVGGSSGGEGCAQSAYFGYFGLGSDIGGSIRMPAYFNGVFGHKPSTMLVPNSGQHPVTRDQGNFLLCTGPICRHAEDIFPLLQTLATGGCDDFLSPKLYPRPPGISTMNPSRVRVSKLKIYCMPRLPIPLVRPCKEQERAARAAAEALGERYGCQVHMIDWSDAATIPKGWNSFRRAPEIWSAMCGADSNTFEELIAEPPPGKTTSMYRGWWELLLSVLGRNRHHTLPASALVIIERIQAALMSKDAQQLFIQQGTALRRDVDIELGANGIIITPTYPNVVPKHNQPLFLPFKWIYTATFNALQTPVTAVPLWLEEKQRLPLGVQVVGSWGHDDVTIRAAEALSEIFGGYRPPNWAVLDSASTPTPTPAGAGGALPSPAVPPLQSAVVEPAPPSRSRKSRHPSASPKRR